MSDFLALELLCSILEVAEASGGSAAVALKKDKKFSQLRNIGSDFDNKKQIARQRKIMFDILAT